ncbi:MAG: hypothetical protein HQL38_03055 [Alphaproteobacteria bacterium]|nr:hypothetical protein [Alphaproteobacteria bacterium]
MQSIRTEIVAHVEAVWRRRWTVVAVTWAAALTGWLGVALLPDQFTSQARIYVETESLLGPLLKNIAIESDLQREVAVMQRTLLSRPNLDQVARTTDLDVNARTPAEMDALYEWLAAHTKILADGPRLFTVSFTDADPVLARDVVQSLLTIFVEGNVGQNRANMENARAFIEGQIADYERKLKAADQRLADFKSRHFDILTGSAGGGFSARLEQARRNVAEARISLQEAISRRDQLAKQLQATPQYLDVDAAPQVVTGQQSPLLARIDELQRGLDAMLLRYTDQHPDVVATRQALQQLERQARDLGLSTSGGARFAQSRARIPNTVYDQIRLRQVEAESDVAMLTKRVSQSEEEQKRLEGLAASAPGIEAQLSNLDRDYGVLKSNFEALLARRESARISQAVDTTTDAIQFRIVEPANVPAIATGPNRPLMLSMVLLFALGAGVGAAILLARTDDTIGAPESLESFGLPVHGGVSLIADVGLHGQRVAERGALVASGVLLIASWALLMIFARDLGAVSALAQAQMQPLTKVVSHGR